MVVPSSSRPREIRLKLAGRLAAYSTAAAASSLLAERAAAEVVYVVPVGGPLTLENMHGGTSANSTYDIDFDGDGLYDFRLDSYLNFSLIGSTQSNVALQSSNSPHLAANVSAGETIGPTFDSQFYFTGLDNFIGTRGFVGVKFIVPGGAEDTADADAPAGAATPGTHFAYLDLAIDSENNFLTYYGGAYESLPDTPITTQQVPEPHSLALLAAGAAGLLAWRGSGARRRTPRLETSR